MENQTPRISFIIVNFQSRTLLARCLSSIQRLSGISPEVILVNNDSSPLEPFSSGNLPIKIIQSPYNLGFGSGVNLGARSASGEYLFLLNPDAEIMSDSVSLAVDELRSNSQLAILGARLVGESGKIQKWIAGKKITLLGLILGNIGLGQNDSPADELATAPVDWVSGAGMIIRKEAFEKLGGFDEKIFMYYEDVDLCRRAKELGLSISYFPDLIIGHLGGKSFHDKKIQKKYYYQSQEYYFQKHFGRFYALLVKWLRIIFH